MFHEVGTVMYSQKGNYKMLWCSACWSRELTLKSLKRIVQLNTISGQTIARRRHESRAILWFIYSVLFSWLGKCCFCIFR